MISFLLGLIPGVGIISSAVQAAFEFLKPVFKTLGEFLAWFFKEIVWEGLKDIIDNVATFLLVAMIALGAYQYGNYEGPKRKAAEIEIVKMQKQIGHLKLKCGVKCGK